MKWLIWNVEILELEFNEDIREYGIEKISNDIKSCYVLNENCLKLHTIKIIHKTANEENKRTNIESLNIWKKLLSIRYAFEYILSLTYYSLKYCSLSKLNKFNW